MISKGLYIRLYIYGYISFLSFKIESKFYTYVANGVFKMTWESNLQSRRDWILLNVFYKCNPLK